VVSLDVASLTEVKPTAGEKEAALKDSGKWVREGIYKFCFELRKKVVFYYCIVNYSL
jgi:hypothetical protein